MNSFVILRFTMIVQGKGKALHFAGTADRERYTGG